MMTEKVYCAICRHEICDSYLKYEDATVCDCMCLAEYLYDNNALECVEVEEEQ